MPRPAAVAGPDEGIARGPKTDSSGRRPRVTDGPSGFALGNKWETLVLARRRLLRRFFVTTVAGGAPSL
jgi:hypothetical protein